MNFAINQNSECTDPPHPHLVECLNCRLAFHVDDKLKKAAKKCAEAFEEEEQSLNRSDSTCLKPEIVFAIDRLLDAARAEQREKDAKIIDNIACFCSMRPCSEICTKTKAKNEILKSSQCF